MSDATQPNGTSDAADRTVEPAPLDDVDVEQNVAWDGGAPAGETLTDEETAEIERQVTEIMLSDRGRGPGEQISVDQRDAN